MAESRADNERLTRVGPGTPMGNLLRRYWWPIATTGELIHDHTKAIKLLGESLTLYKDRQGRYGLIGAQCAHRKTGLVIGIPEQEGLRCPYHGWLYDRTGQCLEMPLETPESSFESRVKIPGYPVEELGGLIFAYLGPEPAPLVPRWDVLVWDHALRSAAATVIPCNWLQVQENAADPLHPLYLHGFLTAYYREKNGLPPPEFGIRPYTKLVYEERPYGFLKYMVREGNSESDTQWVNGWNPVIFPAGERTFDTDMHEFQWSVPMDDTHTYHVAYWVLYAPGVEVPPQETVPAHDTPLKDERGRYILDYVLGQDIAAWESQGEIMDRSTEKLAGSDRGVLLFRRMLKEQMKVVEEGGDPLNVFRDPSQNVCIDLEPGGEGAFPPRRRSMLLRSLRSTSLRTTPIADDFEAVIERVMGGLEVEAR